MGRIEVVKGDITEQDVDAIVNAANEALMGGGGVDGAIHRAAGPGLLGACRALPLLAPGVRCRVGEAKITPGYRLAARRVIHTVAPRYRSSMRASAQIARTVEPARPGLPEELAACYRNCVLLAAGNGLESIAFPSLGTGAFCWPVREAAAIAMNAIRGAMAEAPSVGLARMVCFSDADLAEYERALAASGRP